MRQRSSTATPTASALLDGRPPWPCAGIPCPTRRTQKFILQRYSPMHISDALTSQAPLTELHQYAATAAASRRPDRDGGGDDAFLAACLSDLPGMHRLRRLHPRQLASLLRSLVHMGALPGEDWLADVDTCCYCHPGPFDPASTTAVLQALAALQQDGATATAAAGAAVSASTSGFHPSGLQAAAAAHERQQHQHQGQHCRHQQPRSGSTASSASSGLQRHYLNQQHRRRSSNPPLSASSPSASWSWSSGASAGGAGSAAAASAASFRFPQAVYLRLLQGGVYSYSYDQLATLLQSFRRLGVAVSDDLALQVGSRMAAQLLEMEPEIRQRALAAVLGAGAGAGEIGGAIGA